MSGYKMKRRPPKEFKESELRGFSSEAIIFASEEDIFFPAHKVFPKAKELLNNKPLMYKIGGKHLPSESTMLSVCNITKHFLLDTQIL